jgi:hypothetical protein
MTDRVMYSIRTLVPHASDINVAAILDTIRATLSDLSDIVGKLRYGEEEIYMIIARWNGAVC